jgi:hypothetical protein
MFMHRQPSPSPGSAFLHWPKRAPLAGPYISTCVAVDVAFGMPASKLQYSVQLPVSYVGPLKNGAPWSWFLVPRGPATHR